MAKEKEATAQAPGFGPSPYPFADTIDQQHAEREKLRREELRKQRRMTNPHHAENRQGRPDRLGLPKKFTEALAKQGLMAGWIRKDEEAEYRERGVRFVTHQDIAAATGGDGGQGTPDQRDPAVSPTSVVERGTMVLIMQPKKWHDDRLKIEQHMARTQMQEDPFDELNGAVRSGHFGKGSRRPDALVFDDDDED